MTKDEDSVTNGGEVTGIREQDDETKKNAKRRQEEYNVEDASITRSNERLDNEMKEFTTEGTFYENDDNTQKSHFGENDASDEKSRESKDAIESIEIKEDNVIESLKTRNDNNIIDIEGNKEGLTEKAGNVDKEDATGFKDSKEKNDKDMDEGRSNELEQQNAETETEEYGKKQTCIEDRDNADEDREEKELLENETKQNEEAAAVYIWINEKGRGDKRQEQYEVNNGENRKRETERKAGKENNHDPDDVDSLSNDGKEYLDVGENKISGNIEEENQEEKDYKEHTTKNEEDGKKDNGSENTRNEDEVNAANDNIANNAKVERNIDHAKVGEISQNTNKDKEGIDEEKRIATNAINVNEKESWRDENVRIFREVKDKNTERKIEHGDEKGLPKNSNSEKRENMLDKNKVKNPAQKNIRKNQSEVKQTQNATTHGNAIEKEKVGKGNKETVKVAKNGTSKEGIDKEVCFINV